mgnify:CR=1 FL=1
MTAGPSRNFILPPVSSALLRNGLKVHAVPLAELPLVSVHLVLPWGAEADPVGLAGLADLSAEMLTLGTRKRSASQLAAEVDAMGAILSAYGGWNVTSIHLSGLSEDLERLLELLLEIHTEPAYSPEEFEQLRQRRIGQLVQQKDESQVIAEGVLESADPKTKTAHVKILRSLKGKCAYPVLRLNIGAGQEWHPDAVFRHLVPDDAGSNLLEPFRVVFCCFANRAFIHSQ